MKLNFTLNNTPKTWDVATNESLLDALRRHGVFGVKHGCETGECGACSVLLDGVPVTSCTMLAAQADGHTVDTVEGLGEHPEQGWKHTDGLHPLQQAFIEAGAIQCGYCTPAQLLAADALLKQNPDPTETEVREALSGVLCRCSGYVRPVEAVLRAAARLRGEEPPPVIGRLDPPVNLMELPQPPEAVEPPETPGPGPDTQVKADLPSWSVACGRDPARRRIGAEGRCGQTGPGQARVRRRRRDARHADRQNPAQPDRTRLLSNTSTSARRARCPACMRC